MNDLIRCSLYKKTLIEPILSIPNLDELLVVTGYAASAMGVHHISDMRCIRGKSTPAVKLVCGMVREGGIGTTAHDGFVNLSGNAGMNFSCRYLVRGEPVHAKLYIWCASGKPVVAFAGSANYSQNAFRTTNQRREVLIQCPEKTAWNFYQSLLPDTVDCTDAKGVEGVVGKTKIAVPSETSGVGIVKIVNDPTSPWNGHMMITSTLLQGRVNSQGAIHTRAGLNWGQRAGREKDQAYIPVNSVAQKSKFFPEIGDYFTVRTDDGETFQCVRAQAHGKAIETYGNNSELGRYFRKRIGLASGAYVTVADLKRYGRTDVTFYKIDDENYVMDFSVKNHRRLT